MNVPTDPFTGAPDLQALVEHTAAICICGRAGVVSRPRTGGGRPIWRCEEHRNRWPDYADDIPLKGAAGEPERAADAHGQAREQQP